MLVGGLSGCRAAYGIEQFSASAGTQNASETSAVLSALVEIVETGDEVGTNVRSRSLGTVQGEQVMLKGEER